MQRDRETWEDPGMITSKPIPLKVSSSQSFLNQTTPSGGDNSNFFPSDSSESPIQFDTLDSRYCQMGKVLTKKPLYPSIKDNLMFSQYNPLSDVCCTR